LFILSELALTGAKRVQATVEDLPSKSTSPQTEHILTETSDKKNNVQENFTHPTTYPHIPPTPHGLGRSSSNTPQKQLNESEKTPSEYQPTTKDVSITPLKEGHMEIPHTPLPIPSMDPHLPVETPNIAQNILDNSAANNSKTPFDIIKDWSNEEVLIVSEKKILCFFTYKVR
jgi:hypothetical protein